MQWFERKSHVNNFNNNKMQIPPQGDSYLFCERSANCKLFATNILSPPVSHSPVAMKYYSLLPWNGTKGYLANMFWSKFCKTTLSSASFCTILHNPLWVICTTYCELCFCTSHPNLCRKRFCILGVAGKTCEMDEARAGFVANRFTRLGTHTRAVRLLLVNIC